MLRIRGIPVFLCVICQLYCANSGKKTAKIARCRPLQRLGKPFVSFRDLQANLRILSWLACFAVAFAATTAYPSFAGEAGSIRAGRFSYEVYIGGTHALSFDIGLGLAGGRYRVEAIGHTSGIIGYMIPWQSWNRSEGMRDGLSLKPDFYHSSNIFRDQLRTANLDFAPDGSVVATTVPNAAQDERERVPPEQTIGTLDNLSGALSLVLALDAHQPCTVTVHGYNGRRRYDVVVRDGGSEVLPPTEFGMFSGRATVCLLMVRRLAGFKNDAHSLYDQPEDRERVYTIWAAQILPNMPPVAVRIEGANKLGAWLIHLTHAEPLADLPNFPQLQVPATTP